MARIRTIKPEFFDDPTIGELSPLARLFFIGLWTQADKEGRLLDDSRRLKARIFPYDDVDTEALMVELHAKRMIERYCGREATQKHGFVWIRNFIKHQRPHHKEPESLIPSFTDPAVKKRDLPSFTASDREKKRSNGSLILDTGSGNGSLKLDTGLSKLDSKGSPAYAGFEGFWQRYPRKVGKQKAQKIWLKLKPSPELIQTMLTTLGWQVLQDSWLKDGGNYIPHPSTWLTNRRWQDEQPKMPNLTEQTVGRIRAGREFLGT